MEKLWNINYIRVMTANFMVYFAFYILTPLLPLYLSERFAAGKDTIGVVLSGYTVAALLSRPFSGYIVDSFARKRVLAVSIAVFAVCFTGYIGAGTMLLFALIRTVHGIPFGAVSVANSTVAIDVLPASRRNEGIGFYGLSGNFAMAIAPSLGIYIYHLTGNFMLLFWIALLVAVIGTLMASTVQLPKKETVKNKNKLSLDRFFLLRAWLLAVNIACFGFCFGTLSNYLAIYGKEELNITGATGAFFMILSTGLALSRFQGAKALRKGLLTHNAAWGMCIALFGYIIFAALPLLPQNAAGKTPMLPFYLSALLIGLGNGHMYPAFLNMFINVARHNERGTANSSILTAWDLGFGFGILVGGVVAEHMGYMAAFLTVSAVNATGVILFFSSTRDFFRRRTLTATI